MDLRQADINHLWHPFTDQAAYATSPWRHIVRAEGVYLIDVDGRAIFDGISSWWATAFGHGHPRIVAAIQEQAAVLQHTLLGGQSHAPAIRLAQRLATRSPGTLNHVYFASDGSSVVEAALKMALQYHVNRGDNGRSRLLTLDGAYHGDTFGALGAGYVERFHAPLRPYLRLAEILPVAGGEGDAYAEAERLFAIHGPSAAALIVEPLVQAAGGMRIYPPEYLLHLRRLCDAHGVLLIADEIATGLGRTGTLWACDHAGVVPDILCLGKALGGGYLPISALVAATGVYESFRSDEAHDRTFYDGHTYCGNPIACAAALAALEVLEEESVLDNAIARGEELSNFFASLALMGAVDQAKSFGLVGRCRVRRGAAAARACAEQAWSRGLLIRPLGDVLYLWPPLTTTRAELAAMQEIFADVVSDGGA